jgi:hypothetical protein
VVGAEIDVGIAVRAGDGELRELGGAGRRHVELVGAIVEAVDEVGAPTGGEDEGVGSAVPRTA